MKKLILLSLLFTSLQLQAQTFTNFTEEDGLINNSVNCLALDASDNLWFGTQEGLSYFDGLSWENYDIVSHPELVDNTITALHIDQNNNLWIGTDFGVSSFDGTTWITFTEADGLADDRINYINEDEYGNIWFANNAGVSVFDGFDWTNFTMDAGLPFGGASYVTFDNNGLAVIGTRLGGVYIYDGLDFTTITEDDGLLNDKVTSIAVDASNRRWVGTVDGISVFDANNEWMMHHEIIFELPPPDVLNPVEDIKIAADGRVWVGVYVDYLVTEGGVSTFANDAWEDYDVNDGLIGPVVRRLAIDGQNNIWVVTSTGISVISGIPLPVFDPVTDESISVFPNPVAELLHFEVPADLLHKAYKLFNSIGTLVEEGKLRVLKQQIDLARQPDGVYLLSINDTYARKIIKQGN